MTPEQKKHLEEFIGRRAAAIQTHQTALKAEVSAHDGSHSYGRHGYQAGWEQQLIRCCTRITPDQTFDPTGTGATIRQWNVTEGDLLFSTASYFGTHGEAIEGPMDCGYTPGADDYVKRPGAVAGGFMTPEAQQAALATATRVVGELSRYVAGRFRPDSQPGKRISLPVTSACIVVRSHGRGGFGLGFKPAQGAALRTNSRDEVLRLIDGFHGRKTWSELYPNRTVSVGKFQVKDSVAFPQLSDLFAHLGVEAFWQQHARVVFRRPYSPITRTYGAWKLVTAFPDVRGSSVGWAMDTFLTPQMKTKLGTLKLPKGGYRWTGEVASGTLQPEALNWTQPRPVPAWA